MTLLTIPERTILLSLYDKNPKGFTDIVSISKIESVDCFKVIQRLLIKKFLRFERQKYSIDPAKYDEVRCLLQQKEHKIVLAEQIVHSTLFHRTDFFKLKEVICSHFELNLLRNHFTEIEKIIERISKKGLSEDSTDEKFYFFWGEQTEVQYYNSLKKRYIA